MRMQFSKEEVAQYIAEEDVKFIRLAFCDLYGNQKNLSVMPYGIPSILERGITTDSGQLPGFVPNSPMVLLPDPATLTVLPWRPEHGRVVRMFCSLANESGEILPADLRSRLKQTAEKAAQAGYTFTFAVRSKFYLYKTDETGEATHEPYDRAGYMDIAPLDKGENVRREICLTLEQMGIQPEGSHHESEPGQNEIDFAPADPLKAADDAVTFCSVVHTLAARNGLAADFSGDFGGNAADNRAQVRFRVTDAAGKDRTEEIFARVAGFLPEMAVFFSAGEKSFRRLFSESAVAPSGFCSNAKGELTARVNCDPRCNPYLLILLILQAALRPEGQKTADFPKDYDEACRLSDSGRLVSEVLGNLSGLLESR